MSSLIILTKHVAAAEAAASKDTPATPGTPDGTTATNQEIPEPAFYRSGTTSGTSTGAGRMTLKKMPGAPKNATMAYVFYCNEKRLLVAQMYPDRPKSDITKI
eukprot:scaffold121225_cov31-Attheya_sp.AAC.1